MYAAAVKQTHKIGKCHNQFTAGGVFMVFSTLHECQTLHMSAAMKLWMSGQQSG